ncbi:MAG: tRNA (guanosine(37)-N1)-methyltransferase TrmD [Mogibacterium sp.]|nr:tRNA (guanosine(37)-N1)-methyltransferase TrmD [Mogibacterium sp.]
MKINILTIFPDMFAPLRMSMLGRAIDNGIIELNVTDIRDYTTDRHNRVDDTPYGGGAGMVMQVQPILDAFEASGFSGDVIYMSPRGEMLSGDMARELSGKDEITILCGHYEGVDQRALDRLRAREISIGDYVLTGGELPAMVLIDTVARFIEGVLSGDESVNDESIYSGLLEYPQYSKPREYDGEEVPEILLSGNHGEIDLWRWEQSLSLTKERRPDLFETYVKSEPALTKKQKAILAKYM